MHTLSVTTQAAHIFLRAAAYIRRYGWQEKGMNVHGQPRCSMGALASAYPISQWDEQLAATMYQALTKALNGLSLTQYNHHVQDGEQVAQLYEEVAASLA